MALENEFIYVVVRESGEYSDWYVEPLCWRGTMAEAESVLTALQDEMDVYLKWTKDQDKITSIEEEMVVQAMMDPKAHDSEYSRVRYNIWRIPDNLTSHGPPVFQTLTHTQLERVAGKTLAEIIEMISVEHKEAELAEWHQDIEQEFDKYG